MFRDNLISGLSPEKYVDNQIHILPDFKPPSSYISVSSAELLDTKEYVAELLSKGKIGPRKSPFGDLLLLVKQKRKLRGKIEYRALNRIAKPHNALLLHTDEMFDRLGKASYYSRLHLKSSFHQIRVSPEDIENTAFNIKYGPSDFLVMPMGLENGPATFQFLMHSIV